MNAIQAFANLCPLAMASIQIGSALQIDACMDVAAMLTQMPFLLAGRLFTISDNVLMVGQDQSSER